MPWTSLCTEVRWPFMPLSWLTLLNVCRIKILLTWAATDTIRGNRLHSITNTTHRGAASHDDFQPSLRRGCVLELKHSIKRHQGNSPGVVIPYRYGATACRIIIRLCRSLQSANVAKLAAKTVPAISFEPPQCALTLCCLFFLGAPTSSSFFLLVPLELQPKSK